MSGLIENYIRRIEKLVDTRSTIPPVGTNHVDDTWLETDIYPGELSINFAAGSLYTSDGLSIIDLNKENFILSGLVVSKDTSGVRRLTVSSGHVRINGKGYYHSSSGTDIMLPPNYGNDKLYFIYALADTAIATGSSSSVGNLRCTIQYTYVDGSSAFSTISATSGVPVIPSDGILLGTVLFPSGGGSTGYELWPRSVANTGDYYPKFSTTPSEFLRDSVKLVNEYNSNRLFFPGETVVDTISNTIYLSKVTFVSDSSSILNDVSTGKLISLGSPGASGATGAVTATSLGSGAAVYKNQVGTQLQFRSLIAGSNITLTTGTNEIKVSLNSAFAYLQNLSNRGSGNFIWQSTSSHVAYLKSIKAGSNVTISNTTDHITISVPNIGSNNNGISLGTSTAIYTGMSGNDLKFRSIGLTGGLTASVSSNSIILSGQNFVKSGLHVGIGSGFIYKDVSSQIMRFRSLSAGSNITITTNSNEIIISASGGSGSGTTSVGIPIGASGATVGQIYAGMSGDDLTFRSVTSGYGIAVQNNGNNVIVSSTVTNGATGSQGPQGISGTNGTNGINGSQGPQGHIGVTGASSSVMGPQGFQGFGFQGAVGFQGSQGLMGPQGTPVDMRFIEIYDNTGGQAINGSDIVFSFGATSINTDASLYTTGATSITIHEDGNFQILYTLGFITTSGTKIFSRVKKNGNNISLVKDTAEGYGNTDNITGKIGFTGASGDVFSVVVDTSGGSGITSVLRASSLMLTKLEIGVGPQGPVQIGSQGAAGSQGGAGPTGNNIIEVFAPLTGNGATSTPVTLQYTSDFILDSDQLSLNLEYTDLPTLSISRNWTVKDFYGSTFSYVFGFGSSTYAVGSTTASVIIVPTGAQVNYGGTASIAATVAGESVPTGSTGNWVSIGLTGPTSSYISSTGLTSDTSYSITINKSKEGFGLTDGRVIRAAGNDTSTLTDAVTFLDIFYWGGLTTLGAGNVGTTAVDTVGDSDIQSLSNLRLGGKTQTLTGVTDSAGERIVLAYPASYGDLTNIIVDDSYSVLSAFIKKPSDETITTETGTNITYRVYVAVADDSYSNKKLTIT